MTTAIDVEGLRDSHAQIGLALQNLLGALRKAETSDDPADWERAGHFYAAWRSRILDLLGDVQVVMATRRAE